MLTTLLLNYIYKSTCIKQQNIKLEKSTVSSLNKNQVIVELTK